MQMPIESNVKSMCKMKSRRKKTQCNLAIDWTEGNKCLTNFIMNCQLNFICIIIHKKHLFFLIEKLNSSYMIAQIWNFFMQRICNTDVSGKF